MVWTKSVLSCSAFECWSWGPWTLSKTLRRVINSPNRSKWGVKGSEQDLINLTALTVFCQLGSKSATCRNCWEGCRQIMAGWCPSCAAQPVNMEIWNIFYVKHQMLILCLWELEASIRNVFHAVIFCGFALTCFDMDFDVNIFGSVLNLLNDP